MVPFTLHLYFHGLQPLCSWSHPEMRCSHTLWSFRFYGCKRSVKRIPCGQCFCNTSRIQFHIIKFLIIFGCTVRNGKRCLFFSCVEFFQRNASLSVFLIIGIYFILTYSFNPSLSYVFSSKFSTSVDTIFHLSVQNCAFIRFVRSAATGKHSYAKQKYQHDLTEFLHDFTNPPLFTIHDIIHFSYSHFNRNRKGLKVMMHIIRHIFFHNHLQFP